LCLDERAARLNLAQARIHFAVTEAIDRAPFERALRLPRGRHAASPPVRAHRMSRFKVIFNDGKITEKSR
jgi:hypothetical protein